MAAVTPNRRSLATIFRQICRKTRTIFEGKRCSKLVGGYDWWRFLIISVIADSFCLRHGESGSSFSIREQACLPSRGSSRQAAVRFPPGEACLPAQEVHGELAARAVPLSFFSRQVLGQKVKCPATASMISSGLAFPLPRRAMSVRAEAASSR